MKITLFEKNGLLKKLIVGLAIVPGSSAWAQTQLDLTAFSGVYTHPATSGHPAEVLVVRENQGTLVGTGTYIDYGTDSHTVFRITHVNERALKWRQVNSWGVHYAVKTQTKYNTDKKLIIGTRSERQLALGFIPSTISVSVYQFNLDGSGNTLTINHLSNNNRDDTVQYFRK